MGMVEFGGRYANGMFHRNIFSTLETYKEKKKETVKRFSGTDVYQTVFCYVDNTTDGRLIAPLFFDLDSSDVNYERIKVDALMLIQFLTKELLVPKEYIDIYFSGNKGYHILISPTVLGIKPTKDLDKTYKRIATYINKHKTPYGTVDLVVYEKKRLFRIDNTINSKSGLYKIPITFDELRTLTFDEIKALAKSKRTLTNKEKPVFCEACKIQCETLMKQIQHNERKEEEKRRQNKKNTPFLKHELLPCIQHALDNGAEEGCRNNTLYALCCFFLEREYDLDEVIDMMIEWDSSLEEPQGERDVRVTAKSASQAIEQGNFIGCTFKQKIGMCQDGCKFNV